MSILPVSIIIPTFNRAHSVTLAIDSVLAQGHAATEILVIDDGSTDTTRARIDERYRGDARVRYVYQPNRGASAARNEGLRRASGQFIAFLDSDDRWLPGKLHLQLACFDAEPEAGMIWTDMQAVDPDGRPLHERYLRRMYHAYGRFPDYRDIFQRETTVPGSNPPVRLYAGNIFSPMVLGSLVHTSTVLLRRERVEKAGYFREDLRKGGEDYPFHLQVCREGDVMFADIATIQYQIGSADALTRPEYQLDRDIAYLDTLDQTLQRDRARITIPEAVLTECRADAYADAARAALDAGSGRLARKFYVTSVRLRPFHAARLGFLAIACLPGFVRRSLFGFVRQLRRRRRSVNR